MDQITALIVIASLEDQTCDLEVPIGCGQFKNRFSQLNQRCLPIHSLQCCESEADEDIPAPRKYTSAGAINRRSCFIHKICGRLSQSGYDFIDMESPRRKLR